MLTLDLELDFEDCVIGIVSIEYDYRLTFLLNRKLDLNLAKCEDDHFIHKKEKGIWKSIAFSWYKYASNRLKSDFKLYSNMNEDGYFLIPEWKKYPYLLVYTPILEIHEEELLQGLKELDEIKFADKLNPSLCTNINNLYFVKENE